MPACLCIHECIPILRQPIANCIFEQNIFAVHTSDNFSTFTHSHSDRLCEPYFPTDYSALTKLVYLCCCQRVAASADVVCTLCACVRRIICLFASVIRTHMQTHTHIHTDVIYVWYVRESLLSVIAEADTFNQHTNHHSLTHSHSLTTRLLHFITTIVLVRVHAV